MNGFTNFKQIFTIDQVIIDAIVEEIEANDHLWDQITFRTKSQGTPMSEVSDIILQYTDMSVLKSDEFKATGKYDVLETVTYPAMLMLPKVRTYIMGLMSTLEGERLGRCVITKMRPGTHIGAHKDAIEFAQYYNRYHLALKDNGSTLFRCGVDEDEEYFAPNVGDVFQFDNRKEHELWNDGDTERWTIIVDIKKPVLYIGSYEYDPIVTKIEEDGTLVTNVEAPKRKRGRPAGSKNKVKPIIADSATVKLNRKKGVAVSQSGAAVSTHSPSIPQAKPFVGLSMKDVA